MAMVILVRHGETAYNREEVFRGRLDVPLNDHGYTQARAAGRALARAGLVAVWSSPLDRARETARAIAEPHGLTVLVHDGLCDLDFGDWEGLPRGEVRDRYPDLYRRWVEAPQTVEFPGGETLAGAASRAVAALNEIVAHIEAGATGGTGPAPEPAVAVVSHRVICKLLISAALGLGGEGFWRIGQDTACINVLDWRLGAAGGGAAGEGAGAGFRATVARVNDTCHLGRPPGARGERDF